jgi:hypothetical protein
MGGNARVRGNLRGERCGAVVLEHGYIGPHAARSSLAAVPRIDGPAVHSYATDSCRWRSAVFRDLLRLWTLGRGQTRMCGRRGCVRFSLRLQEMEPSSRKDVKFVCSRHAESGGRRTAIRRSTRLALQVL